MMYKQTLTGCLIVFSTLACTDNNSNTAQDASDVAPANQMLRRNADGELILRRPVIDPASFREVKVGQACGIKDKQGGDLVCQPNARCISSSNESPGMCVAGPRSKKTN